MQNTYFDGKNAYDRWFLPTKEINIGTKYHERCVGNSPEIMPLDNSLNYDLKLSNRYHCAVTSHSPDNDPRKHTMSTPKRRTEGMKKIWEHPIGTLNSTRVLQDVHRAFESLENLQQF